MRNFLRAFRLVFRRRVTFGLIIVSSLVVALFWGGNLGLVKPIVDITFSGKTPHQWANDHVNDATQRVTVLERSVATIQQELPHLPPARQAARREELEQVEAKLASERLGLKHALSYRPWIVNYLPDNSFWALALVVGVLCAATLFKDAFLSLNLILTEKLSQLVVHDLRAQMMRKTLNRELDAFGYDRSTGLLSRFTVDSGAIATAMNAVLGRVMLEPLKALACLIGASLICWRLLLLSLLVGPVAGFLAYRLAQSLKRANRRALEEQGHLNGRITETLTGIQAVKAFGMERYERRLFHHRNKQFFFKTLRIAVYSALAKTSAELTGTIMIALAILAGAYLVLNQQTTLFYIKIMDRPLSSGSLLAFYALLAGIIDPCRRVADVYNLIQRGLAAADRIYAVLDTQPAIVDPPQPQRLTNPHPDVVFDNVSFHYKPGHPVLKNLSLRIPYGKTVAVVGPNGCGKSTLINLLLRFYDPIEGSVKLDQHDLRNLRQQDLRGHMGLVAQQAMLFDDTVMANIRYGSLSATDEEVMEAAKKAHAHRFITEKLEKGYDTVVGERGSKLSGGQRQRILLARAILRDPAILILDEATSQVDLESEQLIHRVLEQFTKGRTTLMITHRVASLALADEVVVLDGGRIIDIGKHEQLLGRCELYSRLYQLGFKAA